MTSPSLPQVQPNLPGVSHLAKSTMKSVSVTASDPHKLSSRIHEIPVELTETPVIWFPDLGQLISSLVQVKPDAADEQLDPESDVLYNLK